MTSELTRERLQEIAEDGFLKHAKAKSWLASRWPQWTASRLFSQMNETFIILLWAEKHL